MIVIGASIIMVLFGMSAIMPFLIFSMFIALIVMVILRVAPVMNNVVAGIIGSVVTWIYRIQVDTNMDIASLGRGDKDQH